MPKKLQEGDTVRLSDREAVAADIKSQLFYPYFRGLAGTVAKVYADDTVLVNIESDSLPEEIRRRHTDDTENMRRKWLDGLSDEARNRLTANEKRFALRYALLVSVNDLTVSESADPPRKSMAEIEAEELQHLEQKKSKKE